MKNKGGCEEGSCGGGMNEDTMPLENKRGLLEKLEIKPRLKEEIYVDISSMHHDSDFESSPSNSPTSHSSSILCSNNSGVSFTESCRGSSSSGRSSSSRSNGCFSVSMSDEDEGDVDDDDDCLDDWEAMADALDFTEDKQQDSSERVIKSQPLCGNDVPNAKQESGATAIQRSSVHCQAWRADDAFRPQSLPNLSKDYSFPLNSVWGCKNVGVVPTSCPICCEDLDCTDSSFLPCLCGFRLCLFCHKRILEQDGRCPGCRKQYDSEAVEGEAMVDGGRSTIRLARSFSMVARS